MRADQVIVGSSGSGKTNLMMRTWAGWYTAALAASAAQFLARLDPGWLEQAVARNALSPDWSRVHPP
jgi:GTPase SAR1 family protein